jgi:hypothetical protein
LDTPFWRIRSLDRGTVEQSGIDAGSVGKGAIAHCVVTRLGNVVDPQFLHAPVEAGAGDSQKLGRARLPLARGAERALDESAFELDQRLIERCDR